MVGIIFLVMTLDTQLTHGHNDAIIKCTNNILYKEAVLIKEGMAPNGMYSEEYDTNKDGYPDVTTLSALLSVEVDKSLDSVIVKHKEHPIFWVVDVDYDAVDDFVYHDVHGDGNCEDIMLYEDLTKKRGNKKRT